MYGEIVFLYHDIGKILLIGSNEDKISHGKKAADFLSGTDFDIPEIILPILHHSKNCNICCTTSNINNPFPSAINMTHEDRSNLLIMSVGQLIIFGNVF